MTGAHFYSLSFEVNYTCISVFQFKDVRNYFNRTGLKFSALKADGYPRLDSPTYLKRLR